MIKFPSPVAFFVWTAILGKVYRLTIYRKNKKQKKKKKKKGIYYGLALYVQV